MLEQFLKALQENIREVEQSFANNPCADFAEYNRRVGTIIGYRNAEQIMLEQLKHREERDKDL